jgi:DNA-binding winged helix-turn-helix (wHTH) protein
MPLTTRVGDADFDTRTGEVRRQGRIIRLEPQPAAVLALLIARQGELVSRDEFRRAVWGDTTHVNFQQSLHYCIRQVRMALADGPGERSIIETIPRRGYRLNAPRATKAAAPIPPARTNPAIGRQRAATRVMYALLAALLIVGTLIVERRPNRHHEIAASVLHAVHDLVY